MRNRINIFLVVCIVISVLPFKAQTRLLLRNDPVVQGRVNIKWYPTPFDVTAQYNLYRRIKGQQNWVRINPVEIKKGIYGFTENDIQTDGSLLAYEKLTRDQKQVTGIQFLSILIKSFSSLPFAKHLGIYTDDDYPVAGLYEYKLCRISDGSETEISSEEIQTGDFTKIAAPLDFRIYPDKRSVCIYWKQEPYLYYGMDIYRSDSTGNNFVRITPLPVVAGSQQTVQYHFRDQHVKEGRSYRYYAVARDFFNEESFPTDTAIVRIKDITPPAPVTNISATVTGMKAKLAWVLPQNKSDVAGVNIYRTNNNDTDYTRLVALPATSAGWTDSTHRPGSFLYRIAVNDNDQNETMSNPVFVETYDNILPQAPTDVTAKSDSGYIALSWRAPHDLDVAGYYVHRQIQSAGHNEYLRLNPLPCKETTYVDSLPFNTKNTFIYKVCAVDLAGNKGAFSHSITARMPDKLPPARPFITDVSAGQSNFTEIAWIANPDNDLMGYNLFRKTKDTTEKVNIHMLDRRFTKYTDRYARAGVAYDYYVIAFDSSGNASQPSNIIRFQCKKTGTDESRITDFNASYSHRKNEITLSWTVNTVDSLKGFIVYKAQDESPGMEPITGLIQKTKYRERVHMTDRRLVYQVRAYSTDGSIYRSEQKNIYTRKK